MPRKCVVGGCLPKGKFSTSKNKKLKKIWLEAIPNLKNNVLNADVCIKYF